MTDWPTIFIRLKELKAIRFELDGKHKGCWMTTNGKVMVTANGTPTKLAEELGGVMMWQWEDAAEAEIRRVKGEK